MNVRSARRTAARVGWLVASVGCTAGPAQAPAPGRSPPAAEVAKLTVTRPTVVTFFVAPPGAVDTSPDLAVTADDWSYAMAALGDSLKARGVDQVMVTAARLRITSRGAAPATLALGGTGQTGFVFVRPGAPPCLRRGFLELGTVLAMAEALLAPDAPAPARRRRAPCARPMAAR